MSVNIASLPSVTRKRDFNCANFAALNQYLDGILWDKDLRSRNVDESLDFLYYYLEYAVSLYVPVFSIRKSFYPTWFSKKLISLIK